MSWRDEAYELAWAAMSLPALAILGAREALAGLRARGAEPTYEEAVAKVLEEGCDVDGRRSRAAYYEGSIWVLDEEGGRYDVETEYGDAHNAARAFVAIERGEA